jgi:predicted phosphodiesterase
MKAILSDIHGNLEALEAVLEDAIRHRADGFYFLGDVVGYGPNPRECLDIIMGWEMVLQGNHEYALRGAAARDGWSASAARSVVYAEIELDAPVPDPQSPARRWAFLEDRQPSLSTGPILFVHGSPRNPLNEYIFPEYIYIPQKMGRYFSLVERYCLMGHTHIPGVFTEDLKCQSPEELDYIYTLGSSKTLVNVGSVGQPRDGDWRACYVLLDGDVVRFRRVEYDVETTVRKVHEAAGLEDFFGDRLREGR